MQYNAEWDVEPKLKVIAEAAQSEPVFIQHDHRDIAVVVSLEDYELIRSAALRELDELCERATAHAEAAGLTEDKLQELLADD